MTNNLLTFFTFAYRSSRSIESGLEIDANSGFSSRVARTVQGDHRGQLAAPPFASFCAPPPHRLTPCAAMTFPDRIVSAWPNHGFAVRARKPRQVGARRTPWISAVMLRKPIATKRAATRPSDLGMGQSIIPSPLGLTAQPGRKKGPFNRQTAPA